MNNYTVSINPEKLIKIIEAEHIKKILPVVLVGDTIKIGFLIKEGNKERIQYYEGILIAQKNKGINNHTCKCIHI